MTIAPLHPREAERLEDLTSLDILFSMSERDFDEITLLASQICETPIALISIVADEKQWFKAKRGFAATETPRDISFCSHAILQDDVMVVNDATQDDRFCANPLTTGETHIRFYAGAPLLSPQGLPIGTVCVIDTQTRMNGLTLPQLHSLKALSSQVTRLLELKTKAKGLKQSEEKLVEASRLSALGLMAVSIAHEVSTPLSIINGKTSLIRRKIMAGSASTKDLVKDLETIEKTSLRIGKIVRGLRMYSRKAENDPNRPVVFLSILEDTLSLCHEKLEEHGIQVQVSGCTEAIIDCRASEIAQILMNLVANSFDAIWDQPEKWIRIHLDVRGPDLQVTLTDSGLGIATDVAEKMMRPFFTTKELGQGTGLGLSISQGIAKAHGGQLVYDGTQKNTTFVLSLPVNESVKSSEPKAV